MREVSWSDGEGQAHTFHELETQIGGACGNERVQFLIGDELSAMRSFLAEVAGTTHELHAEVLVFDGGRWTHSSELYTEIAGAEPDRLVLADDLGQQIAADLQRFLDRRSDYERLGVPWKRGLLLSGPPGNGKTMCLKVLANQLRHDDEPIDTLYVRSLISPRSSTHETIARVFERAREYTPCLLIFEDLDTLIDDSNRSVFLNDLDGLEDNDGIITIATTNHPERLDPALTQRPSRFDRSWRFSLPGEPERLRYLGSWVSRASQRAEQPLPLADATLACLAAEAEGFSFAYLQELMISSLMRWVDDPETLSLERLAHEQLAQLRQQMAAEGTI